MKQKPLKNYFYLFCMGSVFEDLRMDLNEEVTEARKVFSENSLHWG